MEYCTIVVLCNCEGLDPSMQIQLLPCAYANVKQLFRRASQLKGRSNSTRSPCNKRADTEMAAVERIGSASSMPRCSGVFVARPSLSKCKQICVLITTFTASFFAVRQDICRVLTRALQVHIKTCIKMQSPTTASLSMSVMQGSCSGLNVFSTYIEHE